MIELAGGYLLTDIQLACKTDRACVWEPKDRGGDARNADPRVISVKAQTAELAEAKVRDILKQRSSGQ